ncbi:MAG: sulfatase-like hydrolase/transferase, partial [Opitutales bacterium]|nr:sulfatase-like hydrolase/transferase [Opitutales bacterium]
MKFKSLLCVLVVCSISLLWGSDSKPNIVLILSDDQTWTDYGFMGHDVIRTPHLDRLAEE